MSLKVRRRFFDSIISPAILFGWQRSFCQQLGLPNWTSWGGECYVQLLVVNGGWHDAMSKINQKLPNAYRIYLTKSWPERILRGKFRFAAKIVCRVNHWPALCSRWRPGFFYEKNSMCNFVGAQVVHRSDGMIKSGLFSEHVFHSSWTTAARHGAQWLSHEQVFVQFCSEPWWLNSDIFSYVPCGP